MALVVDYRGSLLDAVNPNDDAGDQLSLAIVRGLCQNVERLEPGNVRFVLKG